MFKMIDTDNSGQITLEELKRGLERVGANLKDSEINGLMRAVSDAIFFQEKLIFLFLEFVWGQIEVYFFCFLLSFLDLRLIYC